MAYKEAQLTNVWGSNNAAAKLSEQDVQEIRELYEQGLALPMRERKRLMLTQPGLAVLYDVHQSTITRIVNRQNWKHV